MTSTFTAHFDGKVIVPDEPVDLPINTQLIITVRWTPKERQQNDRRADSEPDANLNEFR